MKYGESGEKCHEGRVARDPGQIGHSLEQLRGISGDTQGTVHRPHLGKKITEVDGREVRELAAPELQLSVDLLCTGAVALPMSKVAVGDWQRLERSRVARPPAVVQLGQLAREYPHRPLVARNMVQHQAKQKGLRGCAQQPSPQYRLVTQIESAVQVGVHRP